jgi:hypothetical protein
MTDQELRIKCAELMGYKYIKYDDKYNQWFGYSPYSLGSVDVVIPDPLNDRNDLHDLIMAVPEEKRLRFANLIMCRSNFDRWALMTPDPRLVMEAFVEVME